MNTDFLLQGHLNDLANKAYQKNIYTFTNFLSASDLDIFYSMLPDISHIPYEIFPPIVFIVAGAFRFMYPPASSKQCDFMVN